MTVVVCSRCDRVIRNYEAAVRWRGRWRHRGKCPTIAERDKRNG